MGWRYIRCLGRHGSPNPILAQSELARRLEFTTNTIHKTSMNFTDQSGTDRKPIFCYSFHPILQSSNIILYFLYIIAFFRIYFHERKHIFFNRCFSPFDFAGFVCFYMNMHANVDINIRYQFSICIETPQFHIGFFQ